MTLVKHHRAQNSYLGIFLAHVNVIEDLGADVIFYCLFEENHIGHGLE